MACTWYLHVQHASMNSRTWLFILVKRFAKFIIKILDVFKKKTFKSIVWGWRILTCYCGLDTADILNVCLIS